MRVVSGNQVNDHYQQGCHNKYKTGKTIFLFVTALCIYNKLHQPSHHLRGTFANSNLRHIGDQQTSRFLKSKASVTCDKLTPVRESIHELASFAIGTLISPALTGLVEYALNRCDHHFFKGTIGDYRALSTQFVGSIIAAAGGSVSLSSLITCRETLPIVIDKKIAEIGYGDIIAGLGFITWTLGMLMALTTNRNNHTTSTKCQYQTAASNPK